MDDQRRRRELRQRALANPPDAGVIAVRHRATGRVVVRGFENLAGIRNRFAFAVEMRSPGALPHPALAADVRDHGWDGLELEVLDTITVEPGTDAGTLQADLALLAELWRERLGIVEEG